MAAEPLPLPAEMVQHRRLRMMRQRQALVGVELSDDFPFERRTDPNLRGDEAYTPVTLGISSVFPYVGVFTTAPIASSTVLPMPGVLMTNNEYKSIKSPIVPTAIETKLHRLIPPDNKWGISAKNPILLIGEPDCAGANIMQIAGKGNVRLSEHDLKETKLNMNVHDKFVVPHDWVFVEWVDGEHDPIPVGEELAVEYYGDEFFEGQPPSCDTCFDSQGELVKCAKCDLRYHPACRGAVPDPFLCVYHDRFRHLEPAAAAEERHTRQRTK